MEIQVKIEGNIQKRIDSAVKNMPVNVKIAVSRATSFMQRKIADASKNEVGIRTGGLSDSWHARVSGFKGVVYSSKYYALYVHEGTRAHDIPNAWGRGFTAKHPGTKANPFARRAMERHQKDINDIFLEEINKAIK